ncbi:hypothetical protein BJY04DRAFT_178626 [Aspergillus karnatakaensis]|uniref:uncharacterized protein n=1 Tax=Aspergillus karnatakaensis TaxID=1810916 RepID=UPI003CCE52DC
MAVLWYAGASIITITLSLITLLVLLSMILFAYPTMRKRHHNLFERVHRFAGWATLLFIWIQTIISTQEQSSARSLGINLLKSPSFWMLLVITLSIASPWFYLRSVSVEAEVLSNHALRLYFNSATIPVIGSFIRLSDRPLLEWHSFATIPEPKAQNGLPLGYSVLISRSGDWTGRQISKPPSKIWVRGIPSMTNHSLSSTQSFYPMMSP